MPDNRKSEHLDISLSHDVQSGATTGFERYRLPNCALPEMDLDEVRLGTRFLGHDLGAPLLISAMTGGTERARELNLRLAAAAQRYHLAMGVGSQRAAIETPVLLDTYQVRTAAPDILLLANLGAVQLNNGWGVRECRLAVESIGADALVLHLNPLQEALQADGNTNFGRLAEKINTVCAGLAVPVIVKEVGWGISSQVAAMLLDAGVAALDIAGAGGTSWSEVERQRSQDSVLARVAAGFKDWGIPTAEALVALRAAFPQSVLIASGGIRSGIDIAKALSLGADLAGIALPLLQAAASSPQALDETVRVILQQLRLAMFCTASRTPAELQREGARAYKA